MTTQLVWFRNDLRLADHTALIAAAARGPVVALFVLDNETPDAWRMGAAQRWWLHHSLTSLGRSIAERGGRLILRRGRAGPIVRAVAAELGAPVHTLIHHEPWAAVQVAEAGAVTEHLGATLAPPEPPGNRWVMSAARRGLPIGAPAWPSLTAAMSSSLGYWPISM